MHKIIPKGKKVRLCVGLNSSEMACKCSYEHCRSSLISPKLIKAYEQFRKLVGVRLKVNSGYRCSAHNFDVGGARCSRHLSGEAIDISLKSLDHLEKDDIEHALQRAGFTFIKFDKTFVHADVR